MQNTNSNSSSFFMQSQIVALGKDTIQLEHTNITTEQEKQEKLDKKVKKCKKNRIVEECRDRRFFEKPSKKRRRAAKLKKQNARKAELERNKKLDIR